MFMLLSTRQRIAVASFLAATLSAVVLAGCAGRGISGISALPATPQSVGAATASGSLPGAAKLARPNANTALNLPIALAEDKHGNLYVGNANNNDILVYNSQNQLQTSKTITDGIKNPAGLAFDKHGNLYVVDATAHEIMVYGPNLQRVTSRTIVTGHDKNLYPSGIAVDTNGNIWVASRGKNYSTGQIQVFSSSGKEMVRTRQHLAYPVGVTIFNGEVWVCDSTNAGGGDAITVFSSSGSYVRTIPTANFQPTYATVHDGDFYTTNGTVVEVRNLAILDSAGNVLHMKDPKDVNLPYGIVFNKAGDAYIANAGNNTITEYNTSLKLIHTIK